MAAAQTVSTISNLLKNVYFDGITDQLNNVTLIYNFFQRGKEDIEGKSLQATFALKTERNQSHGWRDEGGILPKAGKPGYANGTIPLKYYYGAVDFTAQALYAARSSAGAFATLLQESLNDLVSGAAIEMERMLIGSGAGDIARFNHVDGLITAGTAIGVDDPGGVAFDIGMIIEAWDARSGGAISTNLDNDNSKDYITVTAVDPINNTIKFGVGCNLIDNEFLFRTDGTTSSRGKTPNGLRGILQHSIVSTLHGINRSSGNDEWFQANVVAAAGVGLTLDRMQGWIEEAYIRGGGSGVDGILTSFKQRRKYMDIFVSDRRYAPKDVLVNGMTYTSYISGNREVPIIVSRFCFPGEMMFLQKDVFKIHEIGFDWLQENDAEGTVLMRTSNKDEYTAYLFNWINLCCKAPNRCTYVSGLAA